MARPVTLFTGQWADLPLEELCKKAKDFGYDGLELACWGDHFEVDKALSDDAYCQKKRDLLDRHDLKLYAISNHLVGQGVMDNIDQRHKALLPRYVWGDGDPAGVNERYIEEMKNTARAAERLEVSLVNGFTRSSIWHSLYDSPPTAPQISDADLTDLAKRWNSVLDVFEACGVIFAWQINGFEFVSSSESAKRLLTAVGHRQQLGFGIDVFGCASMGVDPKQFIRSFPDRIHQVYMEDGAIEPNEWPEILGRSDDRLLEFMSARQLLIAGTQAALFEVGCEVPVSTGPAEAAPVSRPRIVGTDSSAISDDSFMAALVKRGDGLRLMEHKTPISVSDLRGGWDSTIVRLIPVDVGQHLVLPACYLAKLDVSDPKDVTCCYSHDCGSLEYFEAKTGKVRLQLHMKNGIDLIVEPEAVFTDVGHPPVIGTGFLQQWFDCKFGENGLELVLKPEADVLVVAY